MIKYMTAGFSSKKISEVEVSRDSESSIWIGKKRHPRISTSECYFDTWALAHSYLVHQQEDIVETYRRRLEQENSKLGNIKGMKPPKEQQ